MALKPVFHFARIVAKRTGEHAQIEKRFINPRTSGCIRVSENKRFVACQLFGVLRKYYPINIHEILKFKNVFDTFRYGTLQPYRNVS